LSVFLTITGPETKVEHSIGNGECGKTTFATWANSGIEPDKGKGMTRARKIFDLLHQKWLSLNAEYAKIWPNIMVKKTPPPDSKEWEGKPDKLQYFSPNPGGG
jgi:hypothetical protein